MNPSSNPNQNNQPSEPRLVDCLAEVSLEGQASHDLKLSDEDLAKQEEYRLAYLEQLRRRSCPGCGDDGSIPY